MNDTEAKAILKKHAFTPGVSRTNPKGDPAVRAEIKAACRVLEHAKGTPSADSKTP